MTRRFGAAGLVLAAVTLAACSSAPSTVTTTTKPQPTTTTMRSTTTTSMVTTTTSTPGTTTTTPSGSFIAISSPTNGATVGNPLVVQGRADVYEAVLWVDLTTTTGAVLDHQRVMASSGSGTPGVFSTTLAIPPGTTGALQITAYSLSAKDGSRVNVTSVSVTAR